MIYVALFLSVILFGLGFMVTPGNAKYMLSGYNTMSEAERAKVDMTGYLKFFKWFHIVLGISLFAVTAFLSVFNNNWASIFMTTYPLAAYAYMVIRGLSFYRGANIKRMGSYLAGGILLVIAIVIAAQGMTDYKSSDLVFNKDSIEISGSYGVKIRKEDILNQTLIRELPPMAGPFNKVNGFAGGDYAKGDFRIKSRKVVKLFVNKKVSPILLLNTSSGDIYYNSDRGDIRELNTKIMRWRAL